MAVQVKSLTVSYPDGHGGFAPAVRDVSFALRQGETLGIVGESGSGKSTIGLALMGLLPPAAAREAKRLNVNGASALAWDEARWRAVRGNDIGMVFQDPMTSFNPVRTIGSVLVESIQRHQGLTGKAAQDRAAEALARMKVPAARERLSAYPHELSGGLRKRAMIALATINAPSLLIADEPTTALDATVQAQVLAMLRETSADQAVIMITHDLGAAAALCDRLMVMAGGTMVETGLTQDILQRPQATYTQQLIKAAPAFDRPYFDVPTAQDENKAPDPLLAVKDLRVTFPAKGKTLIAVDGVSLSVSQGETLAIVGESGSGKSTIAKVALRMVPSAGGSVTFRGQDITRLSKSALKPLRPHMQMIFQDAYSSLDPRWSVRRIIAEPLRIHGGHNEAEIDSTVRDLIEQVGLEPAHLERYPAQFSGGQRQRIAIARALALRPSLLIADEPTSALDVTVQAQVISLLKALQKELNFGLLIISHDLPLVHHIADRIAVLYLGRVLEEGPAKAITEAPQHPYTQILLSASGAQTDAAKLMPKGEPASPLDPPSGCVFHPRCPAAQARCADSEPMLAVNQERAAACFFPGALATHG